MRTLSRTRPSGYPFLRELDDCTAKHISLEAAQPNLDPKVLRELSGKTIVLGVLDLGSEQLETAEVVADRIRRALAVVEPERLVVAPDCGMKYLPRERAFAKRRREKKRGVKSGSDGTRTRDLRRDRPAF